MAFRNLVKNTRRPRRPLERFSLQSWSFGVTTNLEDGRTLLEGLAEAINMELTQDGLCRPRSNISAILHPIRYRDEENITRDAMSMQSPKALSFTFKGRRHILAHLKVPSLSSDAVPDTVLGFWDRDLDYWQQISRQAYTEGEEFYYSLVGKYIVITNSIKRESNNISFIDLTKDTLQEIIPARAENPSGLTATPSDAVANDDRIYDYTITVQTDYGETGHSNLASISSNFLRHEWLNNNFNVRLDLPSVSLSVTATFTIYVGLRRENFMYVLARDIPIVSTTYEDNGSVEVDTTKIAPQNNSTIFPDCKYSTGQAGRILLYGDKEDPRRMHYGGTSGLDMLNFQPSNTSGFVNVGTSVDEEIAVIKPTISVDRRSGYLIKTSQEDGQGGEYFMTEVELTRSNTDFISAFKVEPTGGVGSNAHFGAVDLNNNIYYVSRDGFRVFGVRPELQNVIASEFIDQTIRRDSLELPHLHMARSQGVAYKQKIYWTIPDDTGQFNQLWVLDLTQGQGAWMTELRMRADSLLVTTDGMGKEEMLIFHGGNISRYTDDGFESFNWKCRLPKIYAPSSKVDLYALVKGFLTLYNLVGRVKITVRGRTRDGRNTLLAERIVGDRLAGETPKSWGVSFDDVGIEDDTVIQHPQTIIPIDINRVVYFHDVTIEPVDNRSKCLIANYEFSYKIAGESDLDRDV